VILFLEATRGRAWQRTIVVLGFVAVLDVLFVASTALKIAAGGWMPILVAALLYLLMMTWYEGRRTLNWVIAKEQMPERDFLAMIAKTAPIRTPGTAVYFTSEGAGIPRALVNNLRFNQVLHERNILLTFVRPEVPIVQPEDRVDVTQLSPGMYRVVGHFGFMETPNLLIALRAAEQRGLEYRPEETSYVVGRENPIFASRSGMPLWRRRLFAWMGRNSQPAIIHFGVPLDRSIEMGSQVTL